MKKHSKSVASARSKINYFEMSEKVKKQFLEGPSSQCLWIGELTGPAIVEWQILLSKKKNATLFSTIKYTYLL